MNPLHVLAQIAGTAALMVLLYFAVGLLMAVIDKRATKRQREQRAEEDFQRRVRDDPRTTRRYQWRPPRGGMAA